MLKMSRRFILSQVTPILSKPPSNIHFVHSPIYTRQSCVKDSTKARLIEKLEKNNIERQVYTLIVDIYDQVLSENYEVVIPLVNQLRAISKKEILEEVLDDLKEIQLFQQCLKV